MKKFVIAFLLVFWVALLIKPSAPFKGIVYDGALD